MGSVRWRPKALAGIDRLYNFLSEKDQSIAIQASDIIIHGVNRLETMPKIGRPMEDDTNRRELVIQFGAGAYIIRYFLEKNNIVITRVWHSREDRF